MLAATPVLVESEAEAERCLTPLQKGLVQVWVEAQRAQCRGLEKRSFRIPNCEDREYPFHTNSGPCSTRFDHSQKHPAAGLLTRLGCLLAISPSSVSSALSSGVEQMVSSLLFVGEAQSTRSRVVFGGGADWAQWAINLSSEASRSSMLILTMAGADICPNPSDVALRNCATMAEFFSICVARNSPCRTNGPVPAIRAIKLQCDTDQITFGNGQFV